MAKSRSGRSKKRRFTGNRYTIRATINENDETSELNSTESASAKKLESSHTSLEIFTERLFETSKDNRIVSWTTLISFFAIVCCPDCYSQGLELIEDSLAKLCAFLGLPFLSKLAFRNQERKLLKATERVAQENINAVLSEIKGSNSFTKCGISIDGTWQRRGYSSLNGCVSAISVDTGLFISVKDTYGKDSVTKYECIGHVQKTVGARLRKLKSKNKTLSGKGKLTDSFIDRLKNYYGIAVRSNVENLSGLQQNVIVALFHCSSSVEKPMHGQCPIGKDSWCYYQRALSCGKKPNEKYKGLSNEVLNTIKPTYLELCTKELLTKCLHGKTQNSNQCLNGVIWQRVPKKVFVCLKILKSGALDAVIQFNDGYKGCVEIFKNLI
ncbi:uncharacterized protein TNCV_2134221 [Trichonephila clavipes]|nr:uncharacterized protein TNCV_2134221 [Trichonephila clavipes]